MLDPKLPASPFPSSLVTDPTQEAIKELGRDIIEALDKDLSSIVAVSKRMPR